MKDLANAVASTLIALMLFWWAVRDDRCREKTGKGAVTCDPTAQAVYADGVTICRCPVVSEGSP